MKITFVLPVSLVGGGTRVVSIYAQELTARGHEVHVISVDHGRPPSGRRILDRLRGRPWRPMPKPPWFDVLGDRYREIPAGRVVTDSDVPPADIVVATWWQTAEWVARFAPDKGEKFYLLQDYEIFSEKDAPHVVATYSLPMRKLAVSNWIRSTIADRHGIEGIELLPNAVDANHFDAPPRAKRHGGLQVGFLYSPAARKNIALAVAAVVRAREMVQGLRVCAFGCSPPAGTLPLPRWIDFHLDPPQHDIPRIYAGCDLWLFTSRSEGFGLPILEAMACRTPVLATRAGAAPDLIEDHRNGWLLEGEPEAFARTMQVVAGMEDAAWRARSEAAWRTARAWSWSDATDRLEEFLRSAVE